MNPNDFPSFDAYIEEVKRRQQEGTLFSNAQSQKQFNEQQHIAQSKQAEARIALAHEQALAVERGKTETKMAHTQLNGRYYLSCDLDRQPTDENTITEPDHQRLAYIKALKKGLNLK